MSVTAEPTPVDSEMPRGAESFLPDAVAQLVAEYVDRDRANAKLSKSFRLFYRIRSLLPIAVRQQLQRIRNRGRDVDPQWFLQAEFFDRLDALVGQVPPIWPDGASYALVLTHDVETEGGMRRIPEIAEIEQELGFRSSWNLVPYKYKIDRGLVDDLVQRGFEIGIHGYNHDGRLFLSRSIFEARVPWINRAIAEYGAVGFRAPMVHRNLDWLQQLDIRYDASCFDVDPFQAMPGGVGSVWPFRVGKFVELPYTLPQDHTLFVTLGERDDRVWRQKLERVQQWSGMALMLTHPDYLDAPQRMSVYREFLSWVKSRGKYWHVLPREIAEWTAAKLDGRR